MDDDSGSGALPSGAEHQGARDALRRVLVGLRTSLTMERDGLVLVALEQADPGAPAADAGAPGADHAPPPYLLFEQAVADGAVEVREIGAGSVPSVQAVTVLDGAPVGPSVGEGLDVRLAGPKIAGSALVRDGHVVHAELFRMAA